MYDDHRCMTTAAATPDLTSYDFIVVNTSAGKDSQAMLTHVVALAEAAGVRDRLVAVHCDLGRVEWKGTADLAEEQAAHYGVRFIKVSRPQGDLLDQVIERRLTLDSQGKFDVPAWPSSGSRYCTSDHKRGQVYTVYTALSDEFRAATWGLRPRQRAPRKVRILDVMGLRADESLKRSKMLPFEFNEAASNKTVRHVDTWLPIHAWSADEVWDTIRVSGVRYHWAYDAGMPRLSCCFCIMGSRSSLVLAAKLNPELALEYAATEVLVRSTLRQDKVTMEQIIAEAAATDVVVVEDWAA